MSLLPADESGYGHQLADFRRLLVSHDLHGEAWLIAGEIQRRRGVRVDFLDPAFQSLLPAWIESLQASELCDPVLELIEPEAVHAARLTPSWHYCEAAAYVHLRGRCHGSMQRLADFLRISPSWCYRRHDRAMHRSRCLSLDIGAAGREPGSSLKRWGRRR